MKVYKGFVRTISSAVSCKFSETESSLPTKLTYYNNTITTRNVQNFAANRERVNLRYYYLYYLPTCAIFTNIQYLAAQK